MDDKLKEQLIELCAEIQQNAGNLNSESLLEKSRLLYEKILLHTYTSKMVTEVKAVQTSHEVSPVAENQVAEREPAGGLDDSVVHVPIPSGPPKPPKAEEAEEEPEPEPEAIKEQEEITEAEEVNNTTELEPDFFEEEPIESIADKAVEGQQKSVNDLFGSETIQVGVNDRIAFVNQLFEARPEDFNRVISQLNTFSTFAQAKQFIDTIIKPEYNWDGKDEYEERFLDTIRRRFPDG